MDFDKRVNEIFLDIPEPITTVGAVINAVQVGKLIYLSGVLPLREGKMAYKGRVGLEVNLDTGQKASHTACTQALSILRTHLGGSLNKVKQIVSLRGFVASGAEFKDQHKVLDGASQLLYDIFGSAGKHVRTAVGVSSLPFGAVVELEIVIEVKA